MADWGMYNRPVVQANSTTYGIASNPSTATLIAELDSTSLSPGLFGSTAAGTERNIQVTWFLGASTVATWRLEQCLSTGLDMSTAGRWNMAVITPTNQTAQFTHRLSLTLGDRLRVRVNSTFTGNAVAAIAVEVLE